MFGFELGLNVDFEVHFHRLWWRTNFSAWPRESSCRTDWKLSDKHN